MCAARRCVVPHQGYDKGGEVGIGSGGARKRIMDAEIGGGDKDADSLRE
jgi:hypothetical protein